MNCKPNSAAVNTCKPSTQPNLGNSRKLLASTHNSTRQSKTTSCTTFKILQLLPLHTPA